VLRHFKRRYGRSGYEATICDDLVFNACRMTATVDASYFCFRSAIVAASIVAAS
jgi:hypothetical protein